MKFSRGLSVEGRMMVAVAVLGEESSAMLVDLGQILQGSLMPDMQIIVLVKTFNRTITFWMVGRAKNQFGANPEGQSDHLPQNCFVTKTAAETAFIIHLGILSQANLLPRIDQKPLGFFSPMVSEGLPSGITGDDINPIETSYGLTPTQIMGHNIHLDQLMGLGRVQTGVIDFFWGGFGLCFSHFSHLENPFNARQAWQRINLFQIKTSQNSWGTNVFQSFTFGGLSFQFTPSLDNRLPNFWLKLSPMLVRRPRLTLQPSPTSLPETSLPFVNPEHRTVKFSGYIFGAAALSE
jgi:hypothetical protein